MLHSRKCYRGAGRPRVIRDLSKLNKIKVRSMEELSGRTSNLIELTPGKVSSRPVCDTTLTSPTSVSPQAVIKELSHSMINSVSNTPTTEDLNPIVYPRTTTATSTTPTATMIISHIIRGDDTIGSSIEPEPASNESILHKELLKTLEDTPKTSKPLQQTKCRKKQAIDNEKHKREPGYQGQQIEGSHSNSHLDKEVLQDTGNSNQELTPTREFDLECHEQGRINDLHTPTQEKLETAPTKTMFIRMNNQIVPILQRSMPAPKTFCIPRHIPPKNITNGHMTNAADSIFQRRSQDTTYEQRRNARNNNQHQQCISRHRTLSPEQAEMSHNTNVSSNMSQKSILIEQNRSLLIQEQLQIQHQIIIQSKISANKSTTMPLENMASQNSSPMPQQKMASQNSAPMSQKTISLQNSTHMSQKRKTLQISTHMSQQSMAPQNSTPMSQQNMESQNSTQMPQQSTVPQNSTHTPQQSMAPQNSSPMPHKSIAPQNSSPMPHKCIAPQNSSPMPHKCIAPQNFTPMPPQSNAPQISTSMPQQSMAPQISTSMPQQNMASQNSTHTPQQSMVLKNSTPMPQQNMESENSAHMSQESMAPQNDSQMQQQCMQSQSCAPMSQQSMGPLNFFTTQAINAHQFPSKAQNKALKKSKNTSSHSKRGRPRKLSINSIPLVHNIQRMKELECAGSTKSNNTVDRAALGKGIKHRRLSLGKEMPISAQFQRAVRKSARQAAQRETQLANQQVARQTTQHSTRARAMTVVRGRPRSVANCDAVTYMFCKSYGKTGQLYVTCRFPQPVYSLARHIRHRATQSTQTLQRCSTQVGTQTLQRCSTDVGKLRRTLNLTRWTCAQVKNFVLSETGSEELADNFMEQEIDGRALSLLNSQNLFQVFGMPFGLALRFMHRIHSLGYASRYYN